jgi:Tol biopolymer transport system component
MQIHFDTFDEEYQSYCSLKYIPMKRIIVILFWCLGAQALLNGQDLQPEKLLSDAIYHEEVNGELDQAIKTYRLIIKQYSDNREVAAEALLHLGLCYEKKGMLEASPVYRQLIKDYPDQKKEVTIARERLAKFDLLLKEVPSAEAKPRFKKITIPTKPGNGVLSPDGEKMAFTSEGSVWILPVQGKVQPDLAGEPYRITEPMEVNSFSNTLAWSGDGKWIAFNTIDNNNDAIYIVPSAGGEPKKIPVNPIRSSGGAMRDHRVSLSHDGKLLAFSSSDFNLDKADLVKKEPFSIYVYSLEEGTVTNLTEDNTEQPAISPDGKMIAYIKTIRIKDNLLFEGWVIPVTGGTPAKVTEQYQNLCGPVWSPDNRMIAFGSSKYDPDQGESSQSVIVTLSDDGRPLNAPREINLPQNTFLIPAGWTRNNIIGYQLINPRFQALYTVPFPGGEATQVTQEGWANNPCWSKEGKKIIFRWEDKIRSIPEKGGEISEIPIETEEKTYPVLPGAGIHISPDGRSLLFAGYTYTKGQEGWPVHLMIMPVGGGKPEVIIQSPTQNRFPCWSPDGKNIAFVRYLPDAQGNMVIGIYTVPSGGGTVKEITSARDSVSWSGIRYTPDGKHIAYYCKDQSIKLIPVDGGESRELVKVPALNPHNEIIMLKDGEHMAYTADGKIWMVPLSGGEPVQIKTGLSEWYHSQIALSPDGKTIAFTAFTGGDSDLWLMEDFLLDSE